MSTPEKAPPSVSPAIQQFTAMVEMFAAADRWGKRQAKQDVVADLGGKRAA